MESLPFSEQCEWIKQSKDSSSRLLPCSLWICMWWNTSPSWNKCRRAAGHQKGKLKSASVKRRVWDSWGPLETRNRLCVANVLYLHELLPWAQIVVADPAVWIELPKTVPVCTWMPAPWDFLTVGFDRNLSEILFLHPHRHSHSSSSAEDDAEVYSAGVSVN